MREISRLIQRTGTENAFVVGPEIAKLESQGWDIIRLTLGEPGGDMPEAATEEAIRSLQRHETHYTLSQGVPELREKLAEYMTITRGVPFGPENIILTPGGKPVILGSMVITVNAGDEVLVPSPGYPILESAVHILGATPVLVPIREENNFSLDVQDLYRLVTPRTKALIVNSPANPTGGIIPQKDLEKIAKFAVEHDLWVLSDEAYSRIALEDGIIQVQYKGNTLSITPSIVSYPGMAERTVVLDAFSKTYNMTGCRMGWATTANAELANRLTQFAINIWSCLPLFLQKAGLACLTKDQSQAQQDLQAYREKAEIVCRGLSQIDGITCVKPQGSFYAFPNVTQVCKKLGLSDAEELRKYLLTYDQKNKKGVAVLSRIHFGTRRPDETQEYIRIAFPGTKESIAEGMKRIKEAVEK